ncbi:MAG: DegT/DnrJ/EryC1/StrS family aminotransferase [Bifidobacterium psychraerophilum]|uniref:DegT/DnrJ/EryC1/StrS family aminotransferase n=1 Tax=Bifidobacterium psychraerophilum TaxID=218140 RepID=UPI0039E95B5B
MEENRSEIAKTPRNALGSELARRTGTQAEDWYPVFKARYGMSIVFEELRRLYGPGKVSTQLYTCCTAVDPILTAGLTPEYGDVDRDSIMLDPHTMPEGDDTRAVMMQHTFGLMDVRSSRLLAEKTHAIPNALLIEDSAHCVTRMIRDDDGEALADISVHSFGVEKILPTRFGGAIWVNPGLATSAPELDRRLRSRLANLPRPGKRLDCVTRMYINENRVLGRMPGGLGSRMRSWLTRVGLYEPPIANVERRGGLGYEPLRPTPWIEMTVLRSLRSLEANEGKRSASVKLLRESLGGSTVVSIPEQVMAGEPQPLLRFPVFAASTDLAERIIAALRSTGVYAERWYRPELFPGVENPDAYHVPHDRAHLKVTDELVAGAISIPTDLNPEQVNAVAAIIARQG